MIYKVVFLTTVISHPALARFKQRASIDVGANRVDFSKIRGASLVAAGDTSTPATNVFYSSSDNQAITLARAVELDPGSILSSSSVALGGDHVTGPMLFSRQTIYSATNNYEVAYFRGDYSAWSAHQYLRPPEEFAEQNYFGFFTELDHYNDRTLAVSCRGCNVTHDEGGAVCIFETAAPDAKKWVKTATLTATDKIDKLSNSFLSIHNGLVLASGEDSTDNSRDITVVFEKDKKDWKMVQELRVGSGLYDYATGSAVYDQTIVLGAYNQRISSGDFLHNGAVHVFYPSTDQFHLKPPGKPRPAQWSLQQTLLQGNQNFGDDLTIDRNRLVVSDDDEKVYIFERPTTFGLWSLQQTLSSVSLFDMHLIGSTFVTSNKFPNQLTLFDETEDWDCLIVSVEDHFQDGWDGARLTVNVPNGDKDFFSPRCDLPNPFQFRYCPADKSDSGLYKFSIPDAVKARFHWEMVWRVYEEKSGNWFTGNWDTKMDFDWNSDKLEFSHKKMDHLLPNNITCKECHQKPKPKAKSLSLRELHSKDSTHAPTISPAPTMATDSNDVTWQELTMISQGKDWFDAQHRGTNYYISDKAGRRLLSTGTLCPWEMTANSKTCWEEFPDGEYILRVGGALDRVTDHTFKYCKSSNEISQETQLIFRVSNGDCEIVSNANSKSICSKEVGIVQYSVLSFGLRGVSGSLGLSEQAHIVSAVASVLSGQGIESQDISVASMQSAGNIVTVTLNMHARSSSTGVDFTNVESLDAFEANVLTTLRSSERAIWTALVSADSASKVHSVTGVSFYDFHLTGGGEEILVSKETPSMVTDLASNGQKTLSSQSLETTGSSVQSAIYVLSVSGYLFVAVAAIVMVGFLIASRSSGKQTVPITELASPVTRKEKRSLLSDGVALTAADLNELLQTEEASLKTMLGSASTA